ncbi:hypothetical protein GCM10025857_33990 [Alicyclobacillus contaminans]|uniref:hypothetical protein n=1 Tax=Alicyclobacillus contaminans TaxID=392016 RepID=UPI0004238AA0|nr:hypothetical protein [Alicyclobacillus contaminans]GMA52042.1 hypothetical protein GCM10025857_33990 [Alicyclobacillus contaminans]
MHRSTILADIIAERKRQDRLHPRWHGDAHGLAVLAEEFGEVAKAHYELTEIQHEETRQTLTQEEWHRLYTVRSADLREELVQVAAVCVRWLENMP